MPKAKLATAKPKNLKLALKNFTRSLKPWLPQIIIAAILAIGAAVCSIFGPNILGQMTNTAIENYQTAVMTHPQEELTPELLNNAIDWGKLGSLALLLLSLFIISAALNYIQGVILSIVSARYAKKMRQDIIAKISRLPISYFDQHQIGDTISRISSDVDVVASTLANVLTQIITSVTMVIGIFIMMLTISPLLSLIASGGR